MAKEYGSLQLTNYESRRQLNCKLLVTLAIDDFIYGIKRF